MRRPTAGLPSEPKERPLRVVAAGGRAAGVPHRAGPSRLERRLPARGRRGAGLGPRPPGRARGGGLRAAGRGRPAPGARAGDEFTVGLRRHIRVRGAGAVPGVRKPLRNGSDGSDALRASGDRGVDRGDRTGSPNQAAALTLRGQLHLVLGDHNRKEEHGALSDDRSRPRPGGAGRAGPPHPGGVDATAAPPQHHQEHPATVRGRPAHAALRRACGRRFRKARAATPPIVRASSPLQTRTSVERGRVLPRPCRSRTRTASRSPL